MSIALHIQNAWVAWYRFWGSGAIAMGVTIFAFGFPALILRSFLSPNSKEQKTFPYLSKFDFLFLIDYALEYPIMMTHTPLGQFHSSIQIPSLRQISLQITALLVLERAIHKFHPRFPQDAPRVGGKTEHGEKQSGLSIFNIAALEYVAPRVALFSMLCLVDFSTVAQKYTGDIHILAIGLFLFFRTLTT